ncbi:sensor histidine kinase [Isoptericola sp. NPDC057191]|uniref:sensor histidine kinase n=1 Tax=Isoptericola sp. NPDC057191 TaxID=3346041 RepID=UPI003631441D
MPLQPVTRTRRVLEWFGVDVDWERVPADPARAYRDDLWLGLAFAAVAVLGTELGRSIGYFEDVTTPVPVLYLLTVLGAAPIALRRRYPLAVLAVEYLHFLLVGITVPTLTMLAPLQVVYFVALFSAVAWARDRRAMLLVVGAVLFVMFGWIVWQFAVGAGVEGIVEQMGLDDVQPGLISPVVAWVAFTWLINLAYFFGAICAGQLMWHGARRREQLAAQADTIERQTAELQRQAVVTERVRIARELHDVVAHHVSVIGIQAAAARRMLAGDPAAAATPLATIEGESREAVAQMRGLLGTLRGIEAPDEPRGAAARMPEPGLADVPRLADGAGGLDVEVRVVAEPGAVDEVPGPLGLSLYRTAQEALSNVRKHSTARRASVVVRVDRRPARRDDPAAERFPHGFAEVEVLDDGRPRQGSAGTGLGLVGVRERVATHGGLADVGPRATGGYRVRVRLPLPEDRP